MQDVLYTYPSYNKTVAHSSFSYSSYTGTDSYLDMQDQSNYLSVASTNMCVPPHTQPTF